MYKSPIILLSLTIQLFLFDSCKKYDSYSFVPQIEIKSVEVKPNSEMVVSINFTDGDGDFGLAESDTVAPYTPNSLYFNNLFLAYEEKLNGIWQPGLDQSGAPAIYKFRVTDLTPQGKNKSLKGVISATIYLLPIAGSSDTCRFRVKICDRALHMSNEVITDDIIR